MTLPVPAAILLDDCRLTVNACMITHTINQDYFRDCGTSWLLSENLSLSVCVCVCALVR